MTLLEIMIVIVIISMISGAVAVHALSGLADAQRKTVATDFKTLESQLDMYILKKGSLPSAAEGLGALLSSGISRELPLDPWGHPYQYALSGDDVTLTSFGADGAPGGDGRGADIQQTIHMR